MRLALPLLPCSVGLSLCAAVWCVRPEQETDDDYDALKEPTTTDTEDSWCRGDGFVLGSSCICYAGSDECKGQKCSIFETLSWYDKDCEDCECSSKKAPQDEAEDLKWLDDLASKGDNSTADGPERVCCKSIDEKDVCLLRDVNKSNGCIVKGNRFKLGWFYNYNECTDKFNNPSCPEGWSDSGIEEDHCFSPGKYNGIESTSEKPWSYSSEEVGRPANTNAETVAVRKAWHESRAKLHGLKTKVLGIASQVRKDLGEKATQKDVMKEVFVRSKPMPDEIADLEKLTVDNICHPENANGQETPADKEAGTKSQRGSKSTCRSMQAMSAWWFAFALLAFPRVAGQNAV